MIDRDYRLDIIKSMMIIAVILLHALPKHFLYTSYAQLHIWQAVPVFLVLMGYTYFLSMKNKSITFKNMRLKKRFLRLLLPVFVLNIGVLVIDSVFPLNISYTYIIGFFPLFQGPGTYYLLLVVEGTLLLPLLLLLYRYLDNKYIFLLILFVANIIFEVFSFYINLYMEFPLIYSGSIFRYILALGLGLYIYDNYHMFFKNNFIKFLISLSFVYLVGWGIFQYSVPYFIPITKWQNVFSFTYSGFIVFVLLQILEPVKTHSSVIIDFFIITGKASWHQNLNLKCNF